MKHSLPKLILSMLLVALLPTGKLRAQPPGNEVVSTRIGPSARKPTLGLNANRFDMRRRATDPVDCAAMFESHACPEDMIFVCSSHFRISVCLERDLIEDAATGRPRGNMNLERCQEACSAKGRRLPTNNEWLVGCTGTPPEACSTYYLTHRQSPSEILSEVEGHICHPETHLPGAGPWGTRCLSSPDALAMMPEIGEGCVSEAGVRGCVASLAQWVSHHPLGKGHHGYRTNGGSFVVRSAAVDYVTRAHQNKFYHFGSGCRCASEPDPKPPSASAQMTR
jgi:hypothetical protein